MTNYTPRSTYASEETAVVAASAASTNSVSHAVLVRTQRDEH